MTTDSPTQTDSYTLLALWEQKQKEASQISNKHRRNLFWEYTEDICQYLINVAILADGSTDWDYILDLIDSYPVKRGPNRNSTPIIHAVTAGTINSYHTTSIKNVPKKAFNYLLESSSEVVDVPWEDAFAVGWFLAHPDIDAVDQLYQHAAEQRTFVGATLDHGLIADGSKAIDLFEKLLSNQRVDAGPRIISLDSSCLAQDGIIPNAPRYFDYANRYDVDATVSESTRARFREILHENLNEDFINHLDECAVGMDLSLEANNPPDSGTADSVPDPPVPHKDIGHSLRIDGGQAITDPTKVAHIADTSLPTDIDNPRLMTDEEFHRQKRSQQILCENGMWSSFTSHQSLRLEQAEDYIGLETHHYTGSPPKRVCSHCWREAKRHLNKLFDIKGADQELGDAGFIAVCSHIDDEDADAADIVISPDATLEMLDRTLTSLFDGLKNANLRLYGLREEYEESSLNAIPSHHYVKSDDKSYTNAATVTISDLSMDYWLWENDGLSMIAEPTRTHGRIDIEFAGALGEDVIEAHRNAAEVENDTHVFKL